MKGYLIMAYQLNYKFTKNIQRYEVATLADGSVVRDYIKRLELVVTLDDPNRAGVSVSEIVHYDLQDPSNKTDEFSVIEEFQIPDAAREWAKDWAYSVLPNLKLQYESQFNVFHDEEREETELEVPLDLDADGNKPEDNTPTATDAAPEPDATGE